MKILQVITSLEIGGAEHLVVQIVQNLRDKGHEVDVCVFNGKKTSFMLELEKTKCRIISLGSSFYNPIYIFKLSKLMRNYDLVHSHNSSPQLFVAIANHGNRSILVTTEHNTDNRKRHILFYRFVERWMYSKYERIICISMETESNLRDYLGEKWLKIFGKDKLLTIPNGVNVQLFKEAKPKLNKDEDFVIVMVAAFRPQKDHITLLKAMSLLPEGYELWLVGDGELRLFVENEIKRMGLQKRVHLLGNRIDVPEIIKSSDVVVLSSHWEGFGLAAVEGMAAGKPVIVSDVDGLKQVVEGFGILFPQGDFETLAKEIRHLAEDKDYAANIAKLCQQRAADFDISVMTNNYNKLYQKIIEEG